MKSAATDPGSGGKSGTGPRCAGVGGVLVIGYGNSLRGDDAVGLLAAQQLESELAVRRGECEAPAEPPCTILCRHQLSPELAESISHASLVVFLDASFELPAGQVACQPVVPVPESSNPLGHHLTPAVLLALAEALYAARPEGILVTAGLASTAVGEGLSPALIDALPRMVQLACDAIKLHQTRLTIPPIR